MLSTDKQTNKQTDRQTNQRYQKHNLLCQGGNKSHSKREIRIWILNVFLKEHNWHMVCYHSAGNISCSSFWIMYRKFIHMTFGKSCYFIRGKLWLFIKDICYNYISLARWMQYSVMFSARWRNYYNQCSHWSTILLMKTISPFNLQYPWFGEVGTRDSHTNFNLLHHMSTIHT